MSSPQGLMHDSAHSCVKCAKCVPSCTIYSVNRDEITSPRGYLDLVSAYAEGRLSMDRDFKDAIESCFLCTACVSHCPLSLPVDVVIERARVDIAKHYGIPTYKKLAFFLLGNRWILNLLFSLGFYFSPCFFKTEKGRKKLRFSLPGTRAASLKDRIISPLNARSFIQQCGGWNLPKGGAKAARRKVGIYIGCLSNYNYKSVGLSLVKILKKLDFAVLVPSKQACCGAPAFFSGDISNTTRLIKKNLDYLVPLLEDLEALLVPEATCASMLLLDWKHALDIEAEVEGVDNSFYLERLRILTKKTFMASQWLYENTDLKALLASCGKESAVITYHDPCHARKTLNVFSQPRELLQNFRLVEMQDSNACCGFGGVTIQAEKYHLAKEVGDRKARDIASSGASVVSAECSACRLQIDDSLARNGVSVTFSHPLELIAKNLGL